VEERQAVVRLKQGDINGLEYIVRKHQVHAVRAAFLIVRDRALAEDIVQNAFVRAYDRIDQFDASRAFGPWFLKSVINDSLKAIARDERFVSLDQEIEGEELTWANFSTDSASELLEMIERADTKRAVWEALGRLPPAQRAAVVFRYYLDFSEAELAVKMKRPPGTVKWLLHAARQRLREILRPLGRHPGSELPPTSDKDST